MEEKKNPSKNEDGLEKTETCSHTIVLMIVCYCCVSTDNFILSIKTVTIMIDHKQLENVQCFKYLGSMLTNDGRCTCEIKSRIAIAKAAFSKKETPFTSNLDLNLRKKLIKCYI